ncbi:putative N-acetylated-alpha-linked acidic dipeptidase [Hyalella azteca]|uniref:Aminopeptidase NAALADL1 n=1 Tax=Hyalella azteca TaxID=294128 RepID=A0A8B7P3R5_HYAAZ|nr:putative N-acetylated-alpha-linked acidic dipeptidase [Hyalella azteca]
MVAQSNVIVTSIALGAVVAFLLGMIVYEVIILVQQGTADENYAVQKISELTRTDSVKDDFIVNEVNASKIRDNLRYLTSAPHVAGTAEQADTAQWVYDQWLQQGLVDVKTIPYEVLLSYPDENNPNRVRLVSKTDGSVVFESVFRQEPLYAPEEADPRVLHNYNAYSAAATVQGDLVYANYGREEDFAELARRGVDVTGKIVIAKYGKNFRGDKAKACQEHGALGLVLYNDPADYDPDGLEVYPDSVMMPSTATQMGSILGTKGDPQTPFYPAIESSFRYPEDECELPAIPCQPISYGDAYHILRAMEGDEAPASWQGGLNFTYHLGPTLASGLEVQVETHTTNRRATITNVIATIPQTAGDDPDRFVVVGNHRDAWMFGSVDPSSGTAVMMEISRVLMAYINETGWSPRRSIVFCSWDAEEFGLIGSTEWTQQFSKQLSDRAVAYLNIDQAFNGNYTFRAQASPLLRDIIYNATKEVPNPDPAEVAAGRTSVYDTWLHRLADLDDLTRPWIGNLASGSDYYSFQQVLGVPSMDMRYTDTRYGEPLYHTLYETFELVDELYDKGFLYHAATTAVAAKIVAAVASAPLLPYSYTFYPEFIRSAVVDLQQQYGDLIASHNCSLDLMTQAVDRFTQDVADFKDSLQNTDFSDLLVQRHVNDRLMLLEKAFLDPRGLPHRPDYLHVVTSPSAFDSYSGVALAGLHDALYALSAAPDDADLWRDFQEHLASVTHLVASAGDALQGRLW